MTTFDPTAGHESSAPSTTESGAPRENDAHSLSVGPDGPLLLHDVALVEKLARFDRERIPERSPHAKGSADSLRIGNPFQYTEWFCQLFGTRYPYSGNSADVGVGDRYVGRYCPREKPIPYIGARK